MAAFGRLLAVFVAGTVKGTAGLGFPTLATPLLSLAVDVKTAVVLLILPNIVMDGIQFARRGASTETIRSTTAVFTSTRSEEHTSELQSHLNLVCRLLLEKKKTKEK